MIPIEVLIRPIPRDELFDLMLGAIETLKVPARSWRAGSVARTIVAVCAEFGSQGSYLLSELIRGMFLAFGRGDPLTAHAEDVYGVERIKATFASSQDAVVLSNAGGGVYPISANELVVRAKSTGARFRVVSRSDGVAPFNVPAATTVGGVTTPGTVRVSVVAIEAGAASSVSPGEIDELETTLARVSVTNTTSIVGRDAESDDELVRRCLAKRATWSPFGPRDAYEHAALSAKLPDGSPTNITRALPSRYSSQGRVTVVCATPSGAPTVEELAAVRAEIERTARADTVRVEVLAATPVATAHTIVVWARGGNAAIIRQRASAAVATLIATYPIGGISKVDGAPGKLWADRMAAAVISSSPEVFDADLDVGDIALAANEVATNTSTFDVRIK